MLKIKDKQTISSKDKSQGKFKIHYKHILKTLENSWNNLNNQIKLLTYKARSSDSSSIFFSSQCHVDLVFRILTRNF